MLLLRSDVETFRDCTVISTNTISIDSRYCRLQRNYYRLGSSC